MARGLPTDEFLPLATKMGLDTVSAEVMAILTLEDIDPFNEAKASEAQRAAIEGALRTGTVEVAASATAASKRKEELRKRPAEVSG